MESQSHGYDFDNIEFEILLSYLVDYYLKHLIYLVDRLWDIWYLILFYSLFAVSAVAGRLCLQSFNLTLPPYHHYRHLYWTTRHHHFGSKYGIWFCAQSFGWGFVLNLWIQFWSTFNNFLKIRLCGWICGPDPAFCSSSKTVPRLLSWLPPLLWQENHIGFLISTISFASLYTQLPICSNL